MITYLALKGVPISLLRALCMYYNGTWTLEGKALMMSVAAQFRDPETRNQVVDHVRAMVLVAHQLHQRSVRSTFVGARTHCYAQAGLHWTFRLPECRDLHRGSQSSRQWLAVYSSRV